jgi:bacillithiol biosynthesis cysteine-adding enzyme BshC
MECHCIPITQIPHHTLLYTTYVSDFARLREFYHFPPTVEGVLASAEQVRQDPTVLRTVVDMLRDQNQRFDSGAATFENLDRLAQGAFAIVTGQQVGLFTGPSFSIYKALTAISVARRLSDRGTPAVPIFWMATEDHDLAEVQHSYWLGSSGLERLEVNPSGPSGARVGDLLLGDGILSALASAQRSLEGPDAEPLSRALAAAYTPGDTFGSAFAKLFAKLFHDQGLILLDPLDVRLHRLAAPLYARAVEEEEAVRRDLLVRSKQLENSRFSVQVKVSQSSTLLFLNVDGLRLPVRRRNSGFAAGPLQLSREDLLRIAHDRPEDLSASAICRPFIQDALLPTAACIGGPAEIAYLAQSEVVYRRLLGRMPAILPRASFTLVEPRAARLLKKYGLELPDLLRGRQHLRGAMERKFLSAALAKRFEAGEKELKRLLAGIRPPLGKLDRTLLGAVDTAERKMLYQFGRLRGKAARAENFRTGVLDSHERQLVEALYPHHGTQERSLCFVPFLARQGLGLLREVEHRITFDATQHQVLYL